MSLWVASSIDNPLIFLNNNYWDDLLKRIMEPSDEVQQVFEITFNKGRKKCIKWIFNQGGTLWRIVVLKIFNKNKTFYTRVWSRR